MRKTLTAAILLLTAALCLFTACGEKKNAVSADTLEGTYRLVDAFGEGSAAVYQLKDGVRLEIRADNTGSLSLMADVSELRFYPDRMICTSDDDTEVSYTFDGNQLVMDTDPFRMVFERE